MDKSRLSWKSKLVVFISIVFCSTCIAFLLLPRSSKLNLQIGYPMIFKEKEVAWTQINIRSKSTDIFAGDTILFKFRISNIDNNYFQNILKAKQLGFVLDGIVFSKNEDVILLTYDKFNNQYLGDGIVSYSFPGDFYIYSTYSQQDTSLPRVSYGEVSHKFIRVLPRYEKQQLSLNHRIAALTVVILVLTGIILGATVISILKGI